MQKSVLVIINRFKEIPKYKTRLKRHTKLMVSLRTLPVLHAVAMNAETELAPCRCMMSTTVAG